MTTFLTHYLNFIWDNTKTFAKFSVQALYSVTFYQNIYKNFSGWGIRYIMTVSFIVSLIVIIPLFKWTEDLKDYFLYDKVIKLSPQLDHILYQLPSVINYDGKNIAIKEDQPYYIYNDKGEIFAVIDTENNNKLAHNGAKVGFMKDKFYVNYSDTSVVDTKKIVNFDYQQILADKAILLNNVEIKSIMANFLQNMLSVFILFVTPISLVVNFGVIIIKKVINIVIIYIFLNMRVNKTLVRDAFRIVMFSSSVPVIIGYLASDIVILRNIAIVLEIWSLMLMIYALENIEQKAN